MCFADAAESWYRSASNRDAVNDLADHVVLRDDRGDGLSFGEAAVVAEQGESAGGEFASSDVEKTFLDRVFFDDGLVVDVEDSFNDLEFFARQSHDAFDDEFIVAPSHDQITALGFMVAICTFVDKEKVSVTQSRAHAVADNKNEAELGLENEETDNECQGGREEADGSQRDRCLACVHRASMCRPVSGATGSD